MNADETGKIKLSDWIDRRDLVGLGGVILLGVGFWIVWQPLGLIVPGMVLSAVAIFGVKD